MSINNPGSFVQSKQASNRNEEGGRLRRWSHRIEPVRPAGRHKLFVQAIRCAGPKVQANGDGTCMEWTGVRNSSVSALSKGRLGSAARPALCVCLSSREKPTESKFQIYTMANGATHTKKITVVWLLVKPECDPFCRPCFVF